MPKQRSKKQCIQSAFNLAKVHASYRQPGLDNDDLELENINPSKLEVELMRKEVERQKARADKVREENKRVERNLRMRYNREPMKRAKLVSKVLKDANIKPGTRAIGIVLNGFGFSKGDGISARSVSRITKEGGVAAQIQFVKEVN